MTKDPGFNKCHALNEGIEAARGDLISFLDVDTIVGPRWFEGACYLSQIKFLTRLCYRVRFLNTADVDWFAQSDDWTKPHDQALAQYENLPLAFEAYYEVTRDWRSEKPPFPPITGPHVFGNSQFTLRRKDLGNLRFDAENFPRAGHEDLDFIRRFAAKMGDRYQAHIFTAPEYALLHFSTPHPREEGWGGHESEQEKRFHKLLASGDNP